MARTNTRTVAATSTSTRANTTVPAPQIKLAGQSASIYVDFDGTRLEIDPDCRMDWYTRRFVATLVVQAINFVQMTFGPYGSLVEVPILRELVCELARTTEVNNLLPLIQVGVETADIEEGQWHYPGWLRHEPLA